MKNSNPSGNRIVYYIFSDSIKAFLLFWRICLYVCRPLNGKHKITILSALSGSAVKIFL